MKDKPSFSLSERFPGPYHQENLKFINQRRRLAIRNEQKARDCLFELKFCKFDALDSVLLIAKAHPQQIKNAARAVVNIAKDDWEMRAKILDRLTNFNDDVGAEAISQFCKFSFPEMAERGMDALESRGDDFSMVKLAELGLYFLKAKDKDIGAAFYARSLIRWHVDNSEAVKPELQSAFRRLDRALSRHEAPVRPAYLKLVVG